MQRGVKLKIQILYEIKAKDEKILGSESGTLVVLLMRKNVL
jgi:hypothetical protein